MQSASVLRLLDRWRWLKPIFVIGYEFVMAVVFSMPRFRALNALKSAFLRLNGARIGRRVTYYPGVWITPGRNLRIGDDVDLAVGVLIESAGGVEIGDRALIGHGVKIIADNHVIPAGRGRIFGAGSVRKPIRIGSDVWIGANCVVLAGTTIGEGAVVGAGSVVTRDVKPYSVVAGSPARVLRVRD